MRYQYKREPLTQDEANRLANACQTHEEKLVVWTLLDTGLRVAELAKLNKDNLDWQNHRLMIYGKGGPYGKLSKRRIIPLSSRVQPIIEGHLGLQFRDRCQNHSTDGQTGCQPSAYQTESFSACPAAYVFCYLYSKGNINQSLARNSWA